MAKPILYSAWSSSCSWRVRIALHLKYIDFVVKPIETTKGEQLSDEYQQINPMKQVPALIIDGKTLIESVAIIQFLEQKFPKHPILPNSIHERAQSLAIANIIASGIQPLQNLKVMKYAAKDGQKLNLEWARHWIQQGFESLEAIIRSTSGKYSVGDQVSLADITLVPQVTKARQFKLDLSTFPKICEIEKRLKDIEAFQKANPLQQIDCPKDLNSYQKSFFM